MRNMFSGALAPVDDWRLREKEARKRRVIGKTGRYGYGRVDEPLSRPDKPIHHVRAKPGNLWNDKRERLLTGRCVTIYPAD